MTDGKKPNINVVVEGGEDEAVREINERIKAVLDEAPSDASAELVVRKTKGSYRGFLKLFSRQRRFVGGGSGPRLHDVIEQMVREVRTQIKQWRRERYKEHPIAE